MGIQFRRKYQTYNFYCEQTTGPGLLRLYINRKKRNEQYNEPAGLSSFGRDSVPNRLYESQRGPNECIPFSLQPCMSSAFPLGFEVMITTSALKLSYISL